MSLNARPIIQQVTAANAAAVAGTPIFVGGHKVIVQFEGPAAFGEVLVSNDRANWDVADDIEDAAITLITTGIFEIRGRVQWIRPGTATGATDGALYTFTITVLREDN